MRPIALLLAAALLVPMVRAEADPASVDRVALRDAQLAAARAMVASELVGIPLAREALALRMGALGISIEPADERRSSSLDAALGALLASRGVVASPEQEAQLAALGGLPDETELALTRVVDAFLALDAATREGFPRRVEAQAGAFSPDPLSAAGVDVPRILAAQSAFLAAADALPRAGVGPLLGCPGLAVPDVVALDVDGCDSYHWMNAALSIDLGGDDRYDNNAGGGNADLNGRPAAAALVDGEGDDSYTTSRGYGRVGGGADGVGTLVDLGGNDRYYAGDHGTVGGAFRGIGLLVDASGNDRYEAEDFGTIGGSFDGIAALLDLEGADAYRSVGSGANGGGSAGAGLLFDGGAGDDGFLSGELATNGGGDLGVGLLVDEDGASEYRATSVGTNGGAFDGVGALLDAGGDDLYVSLHSGTNGGAMLGAGAILDVAGADRYEAGDAATNGGAGLGGDGLVRDEGGNDVYVGKGRQTNGGASLGVGLLHDLAGDDAYTATGAWGNGGGLGGLLLDEGGRDVYDDAETQFSGDGVDVSVIPKLGGAQVDRPIAGEGVGVDPSEERIEAGPVATPTVEPTRVAEVPPLGTPATCGLDACGASTPHDGVAIPAHGPVGHDAPPIAPIPVGTPYVAQQCAIVVCIGPAAPIHVADTPGHPGGFVGLGPGEEERVVEGGELPALCLVVGAACIDAIPLTPSMPIDTPRVEGVPLAPAVALGHDEEVESSGELPDGGMTTVGPFVVLTGPVPVVLCPDGCAVPDTGDFEARPSLVVYVEVDGERTELARV